MKFKVGDRVMTPSGKVVTIIDIHTTANFPYYITNAASYEYIADFILFENEPVLLEELTPLERLIWNVK